MEGAGKLASYPKKLLGFYKDEYNTLLSLIPFYCKNSLIFSNAIYIDH